MNASSGFFAAWYFHVPNLVLAALMYTLLGRFLLSLLFESRPDATIWRVFKTITDPVVRAVAFVTPRVVPERVVVLFAVVWALIARLLLLVALASLGLAPRLAS